MPVEEVRIGDLKLRVPAEDAASWREAASGEWESETLSVIDEVVQRGDVVIDVGAYVGVFTAVAAGRGAHVHSFEPDPVARTSLEHMLELNPGLASHVTVHPEALGSSDRDAKLSSQRLGNSGSSLLRHQGDTTDVVVRDVARALPDCGLASCSLLKIDVEGAEYEIVPRLMPQLRALRPNLQLAVHTYHLREPFVGLPSPLRGVLYRLNALPRQAKLIHGVRKLGPTYLAEPNSGAWRRLRGPLLLATLLRVGEKELLVRRDKGR